jgi:hypothetical protein
MGDTSNHIARDLTIIKRCYHPFDSFFRYRTKATFPMFVFCVTFNIVRKG